MQLFRRSLITALCAASLLVPVHAGAEETINREQGEALFARLESMIAAVEEIMGLEARREIPRKLLTREEINKLISDRLETEVKPEEVRREELFLKMFGFVPDDFDLAGSIVDVLTEQATALYDYKTRTLYLAAWTPEDMQEYALVHEVAHAIADQHFDLKRYVKKSVSSDGDLARSAVIEGQASWVMTEWAMQQAGKSLLGNRLLAVTAAGASRFEAASYPVYSSAPLYVRETMLFPYTAGLLFQQAVLEKYGDAGFARVFSAPPSSTRQILDAESYFRADRSFQPRLPELKLKGFKQTTEGDVGRLDHAVLLQQYGDEETADALAPSWRGAAFEIWEDRARTEAVLRYASQWDSEESARKFFEAYGQVCRKKWRRTEVATDEANELAGSSDAGGFVVRLEGSRVTSVEGLPNGKLDRKVAEARER